MPNPAHEKLRAHYRPDPIRVLFIGESPPVGGTFFYATQSNLARYTQEAFGRVYEQRWATREEFLRFFQSCGCYLDDLCLDPVNGMTPTERRRTRLEAVPELAKRMTGIHPGAVISVMSGTKRQVRQAMGLAGLGEMEPCIMPFPTFGNQHRYVARLVETLSNLRALGVLPSR